MSDYPPVRVTDHPTYETFDGELILGPADWSWWVVGRFDKKGRRHDAVAIHSSYVTFKEES